MCFHQRSFHGNGFTFLSIQTVIFGHFINVKCHARHMFPPPASLLLWVLHCEDHCDGSHNVTSSQLDRQPPRAQEQPDPFNREAGRDVLWGRMGGGSAGPSGGQAPQVGGASAIETAAFHFNVFSHLPNCDALKARGGVPASGSQPRGRRSRFHSRYSARRW